MTIFKKLFPYSNEKQKFWLFVILLIFVGKLLTSLYPHFSDSALRGCHDYIALGYACPPIVQQTGAIMYGTLWDWLNPKQLYSNADIPYQLYCFAFDFGTWAIQWRIARIPKRYLMFHQLISIACYLGAGHEYQNITVIAVIPFMWLTYAVGIVPLLEKFPVALDWQIRVACLRTCNNPYNFQNALFFHGYGIGHLSNYIMMIILFLLPWHYRRLMKKGRIPPE